jgi:hypothetical protein
MALTHLLATGVVSFRIVLVAIALTLAVPGAVPGQPRSGDEPERDQAFVDSLRRDDPAAADRYVALRDARAQALAEMRKAEAQYNKAGPELRAAFFRPARDAQRKYAQTSLALLEFFDQQDQALITRYQDEIVRIRKLLEERQKTRADIEKLLAP